MNDHVMVAKLHRILQNANVRDAEIIGGVRLSAAGYAKLARMIGADDAEVNRLLLLLSRSLAESDPDSLNEAAMVRFAYEADFLHNVTLRDSQTGDETYLGGSDAVSFLDEIHGHQTETRQAQEVIGKWLNHKKPKSAYSLNESAGARRPANFASEIKNETGSFNFPWRAKGKSGTATAAYSGDDDRFRIKIVEAMNFIGDE